MTSPPARVLGAGTRVAGVIGAPVRHSLSPAIHNAGYAEAGLDWVYLAFEVAPGEVPGALAGMRALGLAGLSVTTPHKDAAWAGVDERSPSAEVMRAVNCVQLTEHGRLVGHNTDGDGFVDSLRRDAGVDPAGLRVVVLGAGGAARSVVEALGRAGVSDLAVVNRTEASAGQAARLAPGTGRVGTVAAVVEADLLINATSVGLGTDALPIDPGALHARLVVADLVYHPRHTALLRAAEAAGARTLDGLGMLIHQAARQFFIWTGVEAPATAMRAAALDALERRSSR
jgi:shikimate dehydrogenase